MEVFLWLDAGRWWAVWATTWCTTGGGWSRPSCCTNSIVDSDSHFESFIFLALIQWHHPEQKIEIDRYVTSPSLLWALELMTWMQIIINICCTSEIPLMKISLADKRWRVVKGWLVWILLNIINFLKDIIYDNREWSRQYIHVFFPFFSFAVHAPWLWSEGHKGVKRRQ